MILEIEINTKSKKVIFEASAFNGNRLDWQKFPSLEEVKRQDWFRKTDWSFNFNSDSDYIRLVANVEGFELPPLKEVKKQVKKCSNVFELETLFNTFRSRVGYHTMNIYDWYCESREEYETKDIQAFMREVYKRFYALTEKRGIQYVPVCFD